MIAREFWDTLSLSVVLSSIALVLLFWKNIRNHYRSKDTQKNPSKNTDNPSRPMPTITKIVERYGKNNDNQKYFKNILPIFACHIKRIISRVKRLVQPNANKTAYNYAVISITLVGLIGFVKSIIVLMTYEANIILRSSTPRKGARQGLCYTPPVMTLSNHKIAKDPLAGRMQLRS